MFRALIHFLLPTGRLPTEFYRNDKVDFTNYRSLRLPDDFSFRSDTIGGGAELVRKGSESSLPLLKDSFFD